VETISHLEHQLASAFVLHSPKEYRHWLHAYARRLSIDAHEAKLQELCSFFVGPPPPKPITWEPNVLGISKRELLTEILPIISTNRSLQRLANQIRENMTEES